jgi:hypothetical protein
MKGASSESIQEIILFELRSKSPIRRRKIAATVKTLLF